MKSKWSWFTLCVATLIVHVIPFLCIPAARTVELGACNTGIMGSIPMQGMHELEKNMCFECNASRFG